MAGDTQPKILESSTKTSRGNRRSFLEGKGSLPASMHELGNGKINSHPETIIEERGVKHIADDSGSNGRDMVVCNEPQISGSQPAIGNNSIDAGMKHQETSKSSDAQSQDATQRRPQMIHGTPLLNEPGFLLPKAMSKDLPILPPPVAEKDFLINENDNHQKEPPVQLPPTFAKNRFPNTRPKDAHILGVDLQALATEQGGIPVSALCSPNYSQLSASSAPEAISLVPESTELENPLKRSSSPWTSNSALPQPLGAHPPPNENILRRSATLPTKLSKRPTFLTFPQEVPKSGASFTRESVLSTPYPGSGFNFQRTPTPGRKPANFNTKASPISRLQQPTFKIPMIVRDGRNCTTGIGKIEIPSNTLAKSGDYSKDDNELALDITREHRRLRGCRVYFSARTMIGVQIVFKSHTRDFYISATEQSTAAGDANPSLAGYHVKENRAAEYIATQRAASRAAAATASKRHLEESINFLLKRPMTGKDSYTCTADLGKLIAEAARPDDSGEPHGMIALEVVEGWNWLRISIAVLCVVLSSMVVLLLWVLIGVNDVPVLSSMIPHYIRVGTPITDGSSGLQTGWSSAGSRVAGGSALSVLVLLLGWSWIGLWMGMSWLIE